MYATWAERLVIIREVAEQYFKAKNDKLTQANFERLMGLTPSHNTSRARHVLINGKMPHMEELAHLGKNLNLSASWLLYGTGSHFKEKSKIIASENNENNCANEYREQYGETKVSDLILKVSQIYESSTVFKSTMITSINSWYDSMLKLGKHSGMCVMPVYDKNSGIDNTGITTNYVLT